MCMGLLSPLPEFIADPERGWGGCGSAGWTPPPHRPPDPFDGAGAGDAAVLHRRRLLLAHPLRHPHRPQPVCGRRLLFPCRAHPHCAPRGPPSPSHRLYDYDYDYNVSTGRLLAEGVCIPVGGGCQWPRVRQSVPLSVLRPGLFLRPRFGPAAQPPGCSLPPREVRPKGRWPCISFSWPKHAWAARASPA